MCTVHILYMGGVCQARHTVYVAEGEWPWWHEQNIPVYMYISLSVAPPLMERSYWLIPNEVLMTHTEWSDIEYVYTCTCTKVINVCSL